RMYLVTRSSPQVAMGRAGSSTILSIAPGLVQSSAMYCWATVAAAASALAWVQPRPTSPLLAWAFSAASVCAGGAAVDVGARVVGVAAGVAVPVAAGAVVALPVAVPVAVSAWGTAPFCAVADVVGVPVAGVVAVPVGAVVGVPVDVLPGVFTCALGSTAWT